MAMGRELHQAATSAHPGGVHTCPVAPSVRLSPGEAVAFHQPPVSPSPDRNRRSARPALLERLPLSCRVVFDVLKCHADHPHHLPSVRAVAEAGRLSYGATWRALRRLRAGHLVSWRTHGRGRAAYTVFTVHWETPKAQGIPAFGRFPQKNDPPRPLDYARDYRPQGLKRISHADGGAVRSGSPRPGTLSTRKAHRWASARIRAEVGSWPIPWERRARIIDAVSWALKQALDEGRIRPGPELGRAVQDLIVRLRMAEAISTCAQAAFAYGRWAVRQAAHAATLAVAGPPG